MEMPVKDMKESLPVLQRYFSRILYRFLAIFCCFFKFPDHLYSTKPTNGCFRSIAKVLSDGPYRNIGNGIDIGVCIQIYPFSFAQYKLPLMLQVNSIYTYFCQHILEKKWPIYRRKFFEISRELSCKTYTGKPL